MCTPLHLFLCYNFQFSVSLLESTLTVDFVCNLYLFSLSFLFDLLNHLTFFNILFLTGCTLSVANLLLVFSMILTHLTEVFPFFFGPPGYVILGTSAARCIVGIFTNCIPKSLYPSSGQQKWILHQ